MAETRAGWLETSYLPGSDETILWTIEDLLRGAERVKQQGPFDNEIVHVWSFVQKLVQLATAQGVVTVRLTQEGRPDGGLTLVRNDTND